MSRLVLPEGSSRSDSIRRNLACFNTERRNRETAQSAGVTSGNYTPSRDEPHLKAPIESATESSVQRDARRIAKHSTRLVDAECPAFGEEVDTTPVDRGLDSKGNADGFTEAPRQLKGTCRQSEPRRPHTEKAGDGAGYDGQRVVPLASQDEHLAHRGRMAAKQSKSLYQVVDVDHVVVDVAAAKDDEGTLGDHSEHLKQPRVAGAVDCGGPCYRERQPMIPRVSKRHDLGLALGSLVRVSRFVW